METAHRTGAVRAGSKNPLIHTARPAAPADQGEKVKRPMPTTEPTSSQPRQLQLVKKDQRWLFRYAPGEEKAVMQRMIDVAQHPDTDFDLFDAAVLCHQMGEHLGQQIKQLQENQPPTTEDRAGNEQTEQHHG